MKHNAIFFILFLLTLTSYVQTINAKNHNHHTTGATIVFEASNAADAKLINSQLEGLKKQSPQNFIVLSATSPKKTEHVGGEKIITPETKYGTSLKEIMNEAGQQRYDDVKADFEIFIPHETELLNGHPTGAFSFVWEGTSYQFPIRMGHHYSIKTSNCGERSMKVEAHPKTRHEELKVCITEKAS